MSDGPPTPERAVASFIDYAVLALIFALVEAIVAGKSWHVWGAELAAAIILHIIGIKWAQIKVKVGGRFATTVEAIAYDRRWRWAFASTALLLVVALGVYQGMQYFNHRKHSQLTSQSLPSSQLPASNSTTLATADNGAQSSPSAPQPETKVPEKATVKPARKKTSAPAHAKEGAKTTPPEAAKMVECGDGRFMPKASDCGVSNLTMRYNRYEGAPPDLSNTHKSSINNNEFSGTGEVSGTDKCGLTDSTVSNNVYRYGAVPDLSNNCNSRFDNNLVLGKGRPKLTIGGEENDIAHNTFPEMDVETTDKSKRNKVHENLFKNPTTPGQVPTAKNGDGADTTRIRDVQTANVFKCDVPCGAHGPYPDGGVEDLPSDLPLAKALHGSSHALADQLSAIIDEGNAIVAAFVADNDKEALNKKQKAWEGKVNASVSNLDPRLRDALASLKSIRGKIDALTIYQNQLRGVGD